MKELFDSHKQNLWIYKLVLSNFQQLEGVKRQIHLDPSENVKALNSLLIPFITSLETDDIETFSKLEPQVATKVKSLLALN